MNQEKLEVVKQDMARVNINILGISKLKWTGMGEINSDDHYIYYCGQESLRRNGVAIMVNKRVLLFTDGLFHVTRPELLGTFPAVQGGWLAFLCLNPRITKGSVGCDLLGIRRPPSVHDAVARGGSHISQPHPVLPTFSAPPSVSSD